MKNRWIQVAVVWGVILAGAVRAEDGQPAVKPRLDVSLVDGSRIVGTPAIATVPVQTPYARMDLPLEQVQSIEMDEDHEKAAIDLRNGDKLKGVVNLGPVELTTLFGKVSIGVEHIRRLDVVATATMARQGLVLWNRLGSEADVRSSVVGPGGQFQAGRFVEGRFGRGVELNMQEQLGVTFPPAVVPGPDGCVEFWAKLVGFPNDLPWGDKPGLIAACGESGSHDFMLHFNGNDGAANGGLCARVAGLSCAGTGSYGQWTYARAMGSDATGAWHHYALVWATDGIPGVENGARKAAVFVDGKLNSSVWNGGTGNALAVPRNGRFGFLVHQGMPGGSVVFDNLKVWNHAKTDFSDRNDE